MLGTAIGAGIFSLPYVFSLAGVWLAGGGMLLALATVLLVNLFYLKIISHVPGDHQLAGYGERFFGKKGKVAGGLLLLTSCWGAVLAYIILGSDFLSLLLGQSRSALAFLFWGWGTLFFWQGLRKMSKTEAILTLLLLILILVLPFWGKNFWRKENLNFFPFSLRFWWGPMVFSLSATSVVPEVEELLRRQRKLLIPVIIWGTVIPLFVYFLFAFTIWGITGAATTADALSGLLPWSKTLVKVGAAIGFLATFTSFLTLTDVIKETFQRDFSWREKTAKTGAVFLSFPAVFLSLEHFLPIISLTGALAVGGSGILIAVIFLRHFARRWEEKLAAFLVIFAFLGGIVSEFF